MDANKILKQINSLTEDLIMVGLSNDQNFPHLTKGEKGIKKVSIGNLGTTLFLKDVSYKDIYNEMLRKKAYNIKMIDGALLLMEYTFKNREIIHHRLSFFPSPDLLEYQSNEEVYFEDDIYLDVLDKQVVTVPLRFDYEKDKANPVEHPVSHLTIGQYSNCRIPVSSALPPSQFVDFIIRNFYHTAYNKYCEKIRKYANEFPRTLFNEEEEIMYVSVPS